MAWEQDNLNHPIELDDSPVGGLFFSPLLGLVLLSLPFFWVRTPGIDKSIVAIAIVIFTVGGMWQPFRLVQSAITFFRNAIWFHTAYLIYLAAIWTSALSLKSYDPGLKVCVTASSFFCLYLGFGARLGTISIPTIKRTFLITSPLALFALACYSQYVFQSLGTNIVAALVDAFQGKGHQIATKTIKVIVNFNGGVTSENSEQDFSGSVRNLISSALCILNFAALASVLPNTKFNWRLASAAAVTLVSPCILLLLMSRSNLIAMAAAFFIAAAIIVVRPSSNPIVKGWVIAVVILATLGIGMLGFVATELSESDFIAANVDRFTRMSEDPRIANYFEVFENLRAEPFTYYGPGAVLTDGLVVHNLILAAWFEAGLFGLISACLLYLAVGWTVFAKVKQVIQFSTLPVMQIAFGAALAVGPVGRRMISGDGGRFPLMELIAIALFFTFTKADYWELDAAIDDGLQD